MMDINKVLIKVPADAEQELQVLEYNPQEGREGETIALLRELVGADYVEHVNVYMPPFGYVSMFVDEDGIAKDLPVNQRATHLYWTNIQIHEPVQYPERSLNPVHGDVVVLLKRAE